MKWKQPPVIKVYEALGAVADERVEVGGDTAKVYSSTGNKFYDVSYDPTTAAIMTNDNGSYWKGYLGYPAIAYLLKVGVLPYQLKPGELLKGIPWKDVNQQFKNDFDKTLTHIFSTLPLDQTEDLKKYVEELASRLKDLNLSLLGKKKFPPEGY